MIKVLTIIGARPQFIKAAVMSRFFRKIENIREVLVHTGQHFDQNMSDIFFKELQIPAPLYNLGINSLSHGKMTGQMIAAIEDLILIEKPHYLLVFGDTNSTLAGALAAKKIHVPVIHIEAGLRSFNMRMPEEINRIVTDRIADILCCPTNKAMENLKEEGFDHFDCTYLKTGDVMEDSVRFHENVFRNKPFWLEKLKLQNSDYILCTVHREENTDSPAKLRSIIDALLRISEETPIVLPVHPRTRKKLSEHHHSKTLHLIEPVGYTDNLQLIKHCLFVMTDSGGMQKEAYMMKKFCLTLRDETEWTELVDLNCNFLTGADQTRIIDTANKIKQLSWDAPGDIYGGGKAAEKIYEAIKQDARARFQIVL
jgi:UDP-GlcNAc3NAcA epimerase